MTRKELRDHIQKLCEENGHVFIMDCVQAAIAICFDELKAEANHIPGRSPKERGV